MSRNSLRAALVALLLGPMVATASCSSETHVRSALAGSCSINSDCDGALVCAFGRCHVQCQESRDCDVGQRCVAGAEGTFVCQLPDETECGADDPCPGEQLCTTDKLCRDGCASAESCATGQVCVRRACADPEEPFASEPDGGGGSGGSGGSGGGSGAGGGPATGGRDAGADASVDAAATCTAATLASFCPDTTCQQAVGCSAEGECVYEDRVPACCEKRVADDAASVYVAPSGEDVPGCGGRAAPCRSITTAVARAQFLQVGRVLVAEGLYTEAVTLVAGVTVEGAWTVSGTTWTPSCASGASRLVTIQGPASEAAVVRAVDLGGAAALRFLTVETRDVASAPAGESQYGVLATGTSTELSLDEVEVIAAAGANGATGAQGLPGADGQPPGYCSPESGVPGADGPSVTASADGGAAASADGGAAASAGEFGALGYTPAAGIVGSAGERGQAGASLPPPCSSSCQVCEQVVPCGPTVAGTVCSYAASPGCGSDGGSPGEPGGGGGASVALYAWGAHVSVTAGGLRASKGGDGGPGGPGGDPGTPSQGQAGFTRGVTCSGFTCGQSFESGCISNGGGTQVQLFSPAGAPGATGGRGGASGGGSAGASCAVVEGGGADVTVTGTTLQHATAGSPGAPLGAIGVEGDRCVIAP